ncbi:MAG: hypothetical protein A3H93_09495 [Rhodocyclales bacterium RIFCSPLOWO2_02_FULL_63_24]|nr:MAG: hypothetical protein A2040_01190 [Rhodocyclales bacterium GWA2_65_19]OHC68836.1 MAG: hypothetical protein A3H93_09495 [Rhodocyclales bacterium RIFCSPLOWO2_02_FULL_63_24]
MKDEDIVERIQKNPKFLQFVSIRNNYSIIMTILMMIVYFGYILLIAFDKQFLATKVATGAVTSIGIPMGIGVLVFTIVITAIYVRRANTEFDDMKNAIVKEASK